MLWRNHNYQKTCIIRDQCPTYSGTDNSMYLAFFLFNLVFSDIFSLQQEDAKENIFSKLLWGRCCLLLKPQFVLEIKVKCNFSNKKNQVTHKIISRNFACDVNFVDPFIPQNIILASRSSQELSNLKKRQRFLIKF